jgi:hypothetical protein
MTSEPHHADPRFYERDYMLDRLIMLSDGVFAFAMTVDGAVRRRGVLGRLALAC